MRTARNPVIRRARPASVPPRGAAGTLNVTNSILPAYLAEKAATVNPSSYPSGYSVMSIASDTSWPGGTTDGLVETWITGAGGAGFRFRQTYTEQQGFIVFHRFGATNDTWASWQLVNPVTKFSATTTPYEVSVVDTVETAHTLTVSVLPTVRFDAMVSARAMGFTGNTTSVRLDQFILGISRDGGSTWDSSAPITFNVAVSETGSASVFHFSAGAITGTIQARLQIESSHADTFLDNMHVEATIAGNH